MLKLQRVMPELDENLLSFSWGGRAQETNARSVNFQIGSVSDFLHFKTAPLGTQETAVLNRLVQAQAKKNNPHFHSIASRRETILSDWLTKRAELQRC